MYLSAHSFFPTYFFPRIGTKIDWGLEKFVFFAELWSLLMLKPVCLSVFLSVPPPLMNKIPAYLNSFNWEGPHSWTREDSGWKPWSWIWTLRLSFLSITRNQSYFPTFSYLLPWQSEATPFFPREPALTRWLSILSHIWKIEVWLPF